ncbi:MAG: TAXI family TRAP transporter solute-binding subunit [Pseudomonadota bacterium]
MADQKKEQQIKARRWLSKLPKVSKISWRDLSLSLGPVLLLSALALLVAMHFVRPAPPKTLNMVSGSEGSTYRKNAEKYADILKRNGITLNLLPSQGSLDNLEQLADPDSKIDIGFVPSGLGTDTDVSNLASLGSVFYQPVSIFYRAPKAIERLSQLKGKRIAVGREGSGTRFLALALLKANGIKPDEGPTKLESMEGAVAMQALLDHKVEAIFLSGDSAATSNLRQLLHTPGVIMFDYPQAEGYLRRFRYLSKIEIPAGAFDLGENLPAKPTIMLAPTVELIARQDLHPALSDLLIEAAREVNGRATLMQKAGEFPAPLQRDIPISNDATRYYQSGKGFMYRNLPFWLASLLDRTLVVLLPILVVLIPGLRMVPSIYGWRIKNRIYRYYGDLMALERAALQPLDTVEREALMQRLSDIENAVITVKMPAAFADQIYVLRQHINFVRMRLVPAAPAAEAGAL